MNIEAEKFASDYVQIKHSKEAEYIQAAVRKGCVKAYEAAQRDTFVKAVEMMQKDKDLWNTSR